jgi:pimeloyl-ACP methyl ester carboxylesterase
MYRHDGTMAAYALLLHGAASTCDFMSRHFPPSPLGVRTTISPQQGHDEPAYVDRLLDLVARLGTPRIVCGVSLGAHTAVALGRSLHPDVLALYLPAAINDGSATPPHADRNHRDTVPIAPSANERGEPEESATDWVDREVARARDLLTEDELRDGLARGLATRGPSYAELASITVPTVIAAWGDDPLHPLAVAERWHAAIPKSRLVILDRADAESNPYLFARAITGSR